MNSILSTVMSSITDEQADAILVQESAKAMLEKLAKKRAEGRGGWHSPSCSASSLRASLLQHVEKGDPVDVMNLAGMIFLRQQLYGESLQHGTAAGAPAARFQALPGGLVKDHQLRLLWGPTLPKSMSHGDALQVVKTFITDGLDGWRLPTVDELESLRDRTRYQPAIDATVFPDTKSEWYWTSTPDAELPAYAWAVGFFYGHSAVLRRGLHLWVRPVRASQ